MTFSARHYNQLTLILFAMFFGMVTWLSYYRLDPSTIFFANDQSTDFIIARLAQQGSGPLLGPPSHTGGRHLGPIYYWFVSFVAELSSFDIFQATKFFIAFKILFASGLLLFLLSLFTSQYRPFVVIAGIYIFSNIAVIQLLRTQWHSNYLIIPSLLAIVSASLVVLRGVAWLPGFLVAITLLALSHLSALPVVLALFIVLLVFCCLPENRSALPSVLRSKIFLLAVSIIAFLLSFPVMFEYCCPSNVSSLFQTHTASKMVRAGFFEAAHTSLAFFLNFTVAPAVVNEARWVKVLFVLLTCAMGLHIFFYGTAKQRWLVGLLVAPLALTTCLLCVFKTPLQIHYFNSSIAIVLILFGYLAGYAFKIVLLPSISKFWRIVGLTLVACIVSALPLRIMTTRQVLSEPLPVHYHALAHLQEMSTLIKSDAGAITPLVYARLAAKPVRNGYDYFLNSLQIEMEYSHFFTEIPEFGKLLTKEQVNRAYVVICPRPYSFTRADILSAFTADWTVDQELDTSASSATRECSLIRLIRN